MAEVDQEGKQSNLPLTTPDEHKCLGTLSLKSTGLHLSIFQFGNSVDCQKSVHVDPVLLFVSRVDRIYMARSFDNSFSCLRSGYIGLPAHCVAKH